MLAAELKAKQQVQGGGTALSAELSSAPSGDTSSAPARLRLDLSQAATPAEQAPGPFPYSPDGLEPAALPRAASRSMNDTPFAALAARQPSTPTPESATPPPENR